MARPLQIAAALSLLLLLSLCFFQVWFFVWNPQNDRAAWWYTQVWGVCGRARTGQDTLVSREGPGFLHVSAPAMLGSVLSSAWSLSRHRWVQRVLAVAMAWRSSKSCIAQGTNSLCQGSLSLSPLVPGKRGAAWLAATPGLHQTGAARGTGQDQSLGCAHCCS